MRFFPFCLLLPLLVRGQGFDVSVAERAVQEAHAAGNFDGVVAISQDGKVVFATGAGFADREAKIPNTPETVFRLASFTKQVTALLVMQEVEKGRLALDRAAGEIDPALPAPSARVTVRQLLQHVSGLVNPSDNPNEARDSVPGFYLRRSPAAADMSATAAGFCSGTPKRAPGAAFEYNNCDYIVLGALLEHVSGRTFARLVEERVTRPLALKSWGVFTGGPAPRVATGYQENGSRELEQNVATYGSSGAIYGNALDVAKWNDALLTYRLLSKESTQTMFRADPKLYGEALGSWSYAFQAAGAPIPVVERQGDIGGTRVLNLLLTGRRASIVILANSERADLFNTYSGKGLGYALLKTFAGGE